MSAALKCPCCGKSAENLSYRHVEAHGVDGALTATVLACSRCNLVLGASINPSEYVAALLRQIRPHELAVPASSA